MFDIMYFYAISVQQEYLGLPIGWRTNTAVYKFNYKHKLCEDGNFVLVCVPLGTSIIISGKKSLWFRQTIHVNSSNLNFSIRTL